MNAAAMRAGRDRAAAQRRRDAIARVRTFRRWSKQDAAARAAGKPGLRIPEIPTDSDYATWRNHA